MKWLSTGWRGWQIVALLSGVCILKATLALACGALFTALDSPVFAIFYSDDAPAFWELGGGLALIAVTMRWARP